ncbi:MAG TPA: class I SAM-dependent methyltransferase [Methanomicrobiales archaeon]|nr:class I SAM-dependent methyltransferase [Methanomicrobiales archaeon]
MTACALCGSRDLRKLAGRLRHGPGTVLVCDSCGLGMLEAGSGDLREFYDGDYRKKYGPELNRASDYREIFEAYAPFQAHRIELLRPFLGPETRLLEVGCSTGHFLYHAKDLVGEAVGVDYDSGAAKYAAERCGITTYGCDLRETPLEPGSFDVVCAIQTMEHVPDPVGFARTLGRYLKRDGTLYIEVPNLADPLMALYDNQAYRDFYFHEAHLLYFTGRSLATVMERAGFVGRTVFFQDYNLMNHLHWLFLDRPQPSCAEGLGPARLPLKVPPDQPVREDLDAFVERADREYRSILASHGYTDNMAFIGGFSPRKGA